MAKLNKKNFLIWEGQFNAAPFDVIATNDNVTMKINEASKVINVLANDIASYGIDKPSLEITLQDNAAHLAEYNQVTGEITYYPPANIAPGQVRQLKYRWYDKAAHISNEATVSITIQDRPTGWRGYAPSYKCLKDGSGENTGQAFYDTLEKYYTDDNTAYVPATLKNNTSIAPDYIPPADNLTMCPLAGSIIPFYVWNYAPNPPSIVIESVKFLNGGVVVRDYGLNNGGTPGYQPSQFQTEPSVHYDTIEVRATIVNSSAAGRYPLSFTPGEGGSGGHVVQLDFPAAAGTTIVGTFNNITLGTLFAGEITLN
jgi:hypothetical protein